tara:strand:- start:7228 stop:7764 length:537 start_codon:yes stop_codon:yes gene_type:complete
MNLNEQLQQAYNQGYTRGIEENKSHLYEQAGTGDHYSESQGPLTLPVDESYYQGMDNEYYGWRWNNFNYYSSQPNWGTSNWSDYQLESFDYNGDGIIGIVDWYILCMMAWNYVPYMRGNEFQNSEYYNLIMGLVDQIPSVNQQGGEPPATQDNSWKRQAGIKYGYIKPQLGNPSPPSP